MHIFPGTDRPLYEIFHTYCLLLTSDLYLIFESSLSARVYNRSRPSFMFYILLAYVQTKLKYGVKNVYAH